MRPPLVIAAVATFAAIGLVAVSGRGEAPSGPHTGAPSTAWPEGEPKPTGGWVDHPIDRDPVVQAAPSYRGRCVDWDSGHPLAGCEISFAGAVARSDGDGIFEYPRPDAAGAIEIRAAGRLTAHRAVSTPEHDLGDVRLRHGVRVTGVIRDRDHHPWSGATVVLMLAGSSDRHDGWRERWSTEARTAADGTFAFPMPLPPGPVDIVVKNAPPLVSSPSAALREAEPHFLELVCRTVGADEVIEGLVQDARGNPVGSAHVRARVRSETHEYSADSVITGTDGRFRLFRSSASPVAVQLDAMATDGRVRAVSTRQVAWGARGVVLELPLADGLRLRVTDSQTGEPIERYSVQCVPFHGIRTATATRRRATGVHEGGLAWVEDVPDGLNAMVVWPADSRWLPSLPQRFEKTDDASPLQVALERAMPCQVEVVARDGRALGGIEVELLRPGGEDLVRDHSSACDYVFFSNRPATIRLARATTDADGRATLRWFHDPAPVELRLHGPGIVPHAERDVRLTADGVRVVVPVAGRVRGTLRIDRPVRLALREVGGDREIPASWSSPIGVGESGEVDVAVPAGEWQLFVQFRLALQGRPSQVWSELPGPVAELSVAAGAVTPLDLDLRLALATGQLEGTAFVDGQPARRIVLSYGEAGPDGSIKARHTVVGHPDARGWFRFADLPAGHFRLELHLSCGEKQIAVPVGDWRRTRPGERWTHPPVAVSTAPVRIRLQDGDGKPRARETLTFLAPPGIGVVGVTDEAGELRLDRVPVGTYRVRMLRLPEFVEVGSLDVNGGGPAGGEFTVR